MCSSFTDKYILRIGDNEKFHLIDKVKHYRIFENVESKVIIDYLKPYIESKKMGLL